MTYDEYQEARFFPSLDGLRCVSIVAVLFFHSDVAWPWLFGARGTLGVDLFFAISGFLITTLLLREKASSGRISLRAFYLRRSLRIFPLYYLILAAFVGVTFRYERHTPEGQEFWRHLPMFALYMNNWVIDLGPRRIIFAASWSLATEEQFYLFWPSIVAFSQRRRWVPPVAIATLMVGTWTLQDLIRRGLLPGLGAVSTRVLTSIAPAICMGCLLAFALHSRWWFDRLARFLSLRWLCVVAAAIMLALSAAPPGLNLNFVRASMVLLLASVVVPREHALRAVLENRLVRHVGVVSYGIYLTFTLVANVGKRWLHLEPPWQRVVWTLAASTAVATLSFRYYETPFLRLKRRFARPDGGRSAPDRDPYVKPAPAS